MAKDPAPAGAPTTPKAGGGMIATLMILGLLTTVAGGVGFLSGHQLKRSLTEKPAPETPVVQEAKPVKAPGVQVLALPSIVTNLAGEPGRWVRLEVSALIAEDKAPAPNLANQLAEDLTALMRTLTVAQISGASGFQHLRDEVQERMRTRTKGQAREVAIQSLVIE